MAFSELEIANVRPTFEKSEFSEGHKAILPTLIGEILTNKKTRLEKQTELDRQTSLTRSRDEV